MISTTVRPFSAEKSPDPQMSVKARAPRVGHGLVIGQEHRDQPGIRGALHVVLAAQRVQPGAGPPDMAAHQRQRDQAARIVGAVDVLADAHAPEDHRRLGAPAKVRATARSVSASMPQISAIFSGGKPGGVRLLEAQFSVKPSMYCGRRASPRRSRA
jgi:hypothetical protein